MNRQEAQAVVDNCTAKYGPYKGVTRSEAGHLMGDERYAWLLKDRIRNLGPTGETLYPWNVVDYLDDASDLVGKAQRRELTGKKS